MVDVRCLLIFFLCLTGMAGSAQTDAFVFFGTPIPMQAISAQERDSLLGKKQVPLVLKRYIRETAVTYGLEDWSLVLFLRAWVAAAYKEANEADQARMVSALLTAEQINNAIGKKILGHTISLIGIKHPGGNCYYNKDGYLFLEKAVDKRTPKLIINIAYFEGHDLDLSAAPPNLGEQDTVKQTRTFINYITRQPDSISFYVSGHYIDFSRAFPMSSYHINFMKSPVSPAFKRSLFAALDEKVGRCRTRSDSINFLLRFVQTVIKNVADVDLYGTDNYPCYPEATLNIAKGDCYDKVQLFGFLVSYYFPGLDFVALEYDDLEHIRLAVRDDDQRVGDKAYIDYQGKRYLIAEVTDDVSVLGDASYSDGRPPSRVHS